MIPYPDTPVMLTTSATRAKTMAAVATPPLALLPSVPLAPETSGHDPLEPWNALRALAAGGAELNVYWPVASATGHIWLRPLSLAWEGRMSPKEWLRVSTLACPTPEIAVVALARRYAQRIQELRDVTENVTEDVTEDVTEGALLTAARWRRPDDMTLIEQALSLLWWRFLVTSATADAGAARFQTLALGAAAGAMTDEETVVEVAVEVAVEVDPVDAQGDSQWVR